MRVLMTGATGLIGKEIGKLLVSQGHQITVVSRNPTRARPQLPFPAQIFSWKGEHEEFPEEALSGVDAIIHLAGEPIAEGRWTEERKKRILNSRVLGTRQLVDAVGRHPEASWRIKTFVSGSAIGFYGEREDEPLNEEAKRGEGFLADVVAAWELEADKIAVVSKAPDLRLVKVRTGVVLSRYGGALAKMLPIFQKGVGGKLGSGKQWMSWIHIDDIARLFMFCLENEDIKGVVNGTAPEPARNDRFTIAFARSLKRPVFLPVPEVALKLVLGEMSAAVLGSQRVLPERAIEHGFEFHYPELIQALENLSEPFRSGQHELLSEQWLPAKPNEVFPFFSNEKNLEELTPDFLKFEVQNKSTDQIEAGTLINYRLKIKGVPLKWQSRIEEWVPNKSFVDVQVTGPYAKWRHSHEFTPFAGGTLLRDRVNYKLPLGWLGDAAASWKVHLDLERIFQYRRQVIDEKYANEAEGEGAHSGANGGAHTFAHQKVQKPNAQDSTINQRH